MQLLKLKKSLATDLKKANIYLYQSAQNQSL